jgi:hypothetical protein
MTTGAIIFAHNNSSIDYIKFAVFAATRVNEYLDIPVSLITDNRDWLLKNYPNHTFDQVIELPFIKDPQQQKRFHDGSLAHKQLEWKNVTRTQIYNLTPYDRTLVIDSDYIINSSVLKPALENDYEFQIYRNSFDLALDRDPDTFTRINAYSIPFYWATVFIFSKSTVMQAFFDLVEYIKNNWIYFKTLYSLDSTMYRNDFAFSIAIHIMNNKTSGEFAIELPGNMIYATDRDILVAAQNDKMKFLVEKKDHLGEYTLVKTSGLDVHVMNKFSLARHIDGVKFD